jgi:hypothetical protein
MYGIALVEQSILGIDWRWAVSIADAAYWIRVV